MRKILHARTKVDLQKQIASHCSRGYTQKCKKTCATKDADGYKKVNHYRLPSICSSDQEIYSEILHFEINDFERIVTTLIREEELKKLVSKDVFYRRYKCYYAARQGEENE